MNQIPRLYTAQEAADFLRLSVSRFRQLVKLGRLPARKVGQKLLIAHDDIVNYLNGPANG